MIDLRPALESPTAAFADAWRVGESCFYWERPGDGFALVGVGVEREFDLSPTTRMDQARRALAGLPAGAALVGGFSFDPSRTSEGLWQGFGAGRLVQPRRLCAHHGQTTSKRPASGPRLSLEDRRPADEWKALVSAATGAIRAGGLEKVVLARAVRARAATPLDPAATIERLREAYPTCTVFAIAEGGKCFLGATPERLVSLSRGEVRVSCLAGTSPRGATPEEDERLGRALLASAKNRHEHAVVARTLREQLVDVCDGLRVPLEPSLMRVRNVQHLYTPITGRIRPGGTLLDLVERLHPTPAVGGVPREAALALIREHEGLDRGWYAGPVGWIGADGEGDFAVAIRSALITQPDEAVLFAGCGIVADSDPEAEYQESVLKLRPMLAALGAP